MFGENERFDEVKGIFIVLDGAADEPCKVLEGKTPLQAALTPNLDYFAGRSRVDYCYPVKEGFAPDSASALVSLFGYDYRDVSLGCLEALGEGIPLTKGDLAMRVNFASVDDLREGNILDSRAGRTLNAKEAEVLAEEVNGKVKLPFQFEFYPTMHHRGIVIFRGGFSDNISNANPFYRNGMAISGVMPRISFSKPMDEEEDSRLSANLINGFVRKSHEVLDNHYVNNLRVRKGLFAANCLLCREAGSKLPRFKKLQGAWIALAYGSMEKGFAKATKMHLYHFQYPKMKDMDVYGNLHKGLNVAIRNSIKMLKRNNGKYDYFYIHLKETDIAGLDNKPIEKKRMIELIDKKLFSFLKGFVVKNNVKLVVTSNYTTSSRLKAHTAGAVPVLFYDLENLHDNEGRFTERDARRGKKIIGKNLLERTLFRE